MKDEASQLETPTRHTTDQAWSGTRLGVISLGGRDGGRKGKERQLELGTFGGQGGNLVHTIKLETQRKIVCITNKITVQDRFDFQSKGTHIFEQWQQQRSQGTRVSKCHLLEQNTPLAPMTLYLWQIPDISSKYVSRHYASFEKVHLLNSQNSFDITPPQKAILPLFFHSLTRLLKKNNLGICFEMTERKEEETKKDKKIKGHAPGSQRDGLS